MDRTFIARLAQHVAAERVKSAGGFGEMMKAAPGLIERGSQILGHAVPAAERSLAHAAPAAGRALAPAASRAPWMLRSPGRALGSAVAAAPVAYGAALGGTHLYNALTDPTRSMTPEQRYAYHTSQYGQKVAPLEGEATSAILAGNDDKFNELMTKMPSAGGNSWLRRNLAPWLGNERPAGFHQEQAGTAQTELQTEYDKAMQKHTDQPGQYDQQIQRLQSMLSGGGLVPQQKRLIQMQMEQLKRRLGSRGAESPEALAIAQRMRGAGMDIRPWPGAAPAGPAPAGGGPPGRFPPGYGNYLTRDDFRPSWDTVPEQPR